MNTQASLYGAEINAIGAAECFLEQSRYRGGDSYSVADLVAGTIVHATRDSIDCADRPRLARWFDEVSNRPAFTPVRHQSA